ncbi:MAG: ComF family protein [Wenzhouxiangellaceae bacterium]|nr:ComF family protein [Wenzhouxiangellaceae bacterium]
MLLVDGFVERVWPPVCPACGMAHAGRPGLCAGCCAELPAAQSGCRRCAMVLPREVETCGACQRRPPPFDAAHAAWRYAFPVDGLIQRFKFRGDRVAGRALATAMAGRLASLGAPRPDLIVPVPLHWRRRLARGFNQSAWLARDLSAALGRLPWAPALERRRATSTQSSLPAGRRSGNVRGAFEVRGLPPGTRHVALVDDVMTTGATLAECARCLKRAGVTRVEAWVAARA